MYCKECGNKISEENKGKCGFCGYSLEQKKNKKSDKISDGIKLLILFCIFLILFGATIIVISALNLVPLLWLGIILIILAIVIPLFFVMFQFFINYSTNIQKNVNQQILPNYFASLQNQSVSNNLISYQKFDKINSETTIAQAKEMLGEGKVIFSGKENGKEIRTIVWQEGVATVYSPMLKTITIKFQEGKAIEKSQAGL